MKLFIFAAIGFIVFLTIGFFITPLLAVSEGFELLAAGALTANIGNKLKSIKEYARAHLIAVWAVFSILFAITVHFLFHFGGSFTVKTKIYNLNANRYEH